MSTKTTGTVTLQVVGHDEKNDVPPVALTGVTVQVQRRDAERRKYVTDASGVVVVDLPEGHYTAWVAGGRDTPLPKTGAMASVGGAAFDVHPGCDFVQTLTVPLEMFLKVTDPDGETETLSSQDLIVGRSIKLQLSLSKYEELQDRLGVDALRLGLVGDGLEVFEQMAPKATASKSLQRVFIIRPTRSGPTSLFFSAGAVTGIPGRNAPAKFPMVARMPDPTPIEGGITVGMRRAASRGTKDVPLWVAIRKSTDALSFARYFDFMNWVFCGGADDPAAIDRDKSMRALIKVGSRRLLPFTDTDAYRNVKFATEAFIMANCGVMKTFGRAESDYILGESITFTGTLSTELEDYLLPLGEGSSDRVLPYLAAIRAKLHDQPLTTADLGEIDLTVTPGDVNACYGILQHKLQCPCLLELIWSYWQEEGMLVQTMNAVARRFQNVRGPLGNDPLANLEIDPLRPLNNLIWGYIQDEIHRLSVVRRNYEYDHHYGLRLAGRAVRDMRTADSRSRFLQAFHTLLSTAAAFYKRDDDTTIVADGFPVLNALKEAHLILSQGAHNQFGDLPSTARIEMLMQQWILSRPEFREFLPTRIMVAYPEPWMDRVDAMKKLQGWTDTSVLHFRNLAVFGEQVLLSVRYGNWSDVNDPVQGTNWARYWRSEIQGYMHAYRSVTGVDLTVDVTNARIDATIPSVHLVQRLAEQQRRA